MTLQIVPIAEAHAASFRECLDTVAREKRYLAQTEAPPLDGVTAFVRQSVASDAAQFVALDGDRVVGWADIFAAWPQATNHRAGLGIGVLPEYRGRGVGSSLLEACIAKAWSQGLTRVELEVRADNTAAIKLYEKFGFVREGVKRRAMRFDGTYYDAIEMALLKG